LTDNSAKEIAVYLWQYLLPGDVQDGIDLEVPSWLVRDAVEAMDKLAALEQRVERLEDALIWCSSSDDFQEGGKAREGWLKLCAPLLAKEAELGQHFRIKWRGGVLTPDLVHALVWDYLSKFGGEAVGLEVEEMP